MNGRMNRAIAATTMLGMSVGPLGCGYILYPERRGAQSGVIDSGTMVMDLLWLIPGILPGVIALIVDFSSGAIYVRGRTALRLSPDGHLAVRLPSSSKPIRLEFRVVTASNGVVAHRTVAIGPSTPAGESVDLSLGDSIRANGADAGAAQRERERGRGLGPLYLEVQTDGGAFARFPTPIEVTPRA
jgi:hypothetical protein